MNQKKKSLIVLGTLLVTGFALRIWGINWGLPLKYAHIDESVVIFYSFRFFTGDLNPHVFFDYPTLFLYIIYAVQFTYFLIGSLFGIFTSLDQFAGKYFLGDISDIYIIARMLSVLAGTATIYLIYKISKLFYSEKVSLLACCFMCLNWLHILHSHYATVDVAALFMTMLSVYFMCEYFISEKRNSFLFSCFTLGLATATKYYSLVFFANLLIIPLLKKNKFSKILIKLYFPGLLLVIAGFFLGCPYSILDFSAFSARFTTIYTNVVKPENFNFFKNFIIIFSHINNSTGIVFFIISLAAIAFSFGTITEIFILSFFAVFFIFSSGFKMIGAHYIFPLYPFIFILTAKGLENASKKYHPAIFYLISALFVITALPEIIHNNYILTQKDTRLTAYDWTIQNIPKKSKILRFPYTSEFRQSDGYSVIIDWDYKTPAEEYNKYDYLITSGKDENIGSNFTLIKSFSGLQLSGFHNPTVNVYKKGRLRH